MIRITDTDIRSLRREAASAGDTAQVDLCDLALTLSELRAEAEADDAGVEDTDFQRAHGRPVLAEAQAAWNACVEAIQAAEAMDDES